MSEPMTPKPTSPSSPYSSWSPIPFYDPHFHIWDCSDDGKGRSCLHSLKTLGEPAEKFPVYRTADYEAHIKSACSIPKYQDSPNSTITGGGDSFATASTATDVEGAPLGCWAAHIGGVFVEALPNEDQALEELCWVIRELASSPLEYRLIARANFVRMTAAAKTICGTTEAVVPSCPWSSAKAQEKFFASAGSCSHQLALCGGLRGVRQILNHEPSWPFITHDLLQCKAWLAAVTTALQENNPATGCPAIQVFELHCNPHQLQDAVDKLVKPNPRTLFVLNHLGCKRANDPETVFWPAVNALAACSNGFVKLSDVPAASAAASDDDEANYNVSDSWDSDPGLIKLVRGLISAFSPERCMVASNYPVSLVSGATPERFFRWLQCKLFSDRGHGEQLVEGDVKELYTREEVEAMMAGTALRVYGSLK